MDLAIAEVFFPAKLRNRETTEFCIKLAKAIATVLLVELEDTSKATHQYVSACLGDRSIAVITREEELSTVGLRATNDPSEGSFATFTDVLVTGGRISLQAAAGIGQMRYNGDMNRNHQSAVEMQILTTMDQLECFTAYLRNAPHPWFLWQNERQSVSEKIFNANLMNAEHTTTTR
jgi:hypothetical protein